MNILRTYCLENNFINKSLYELDSEQIEMIVDTWGFQSYEAGVKLNKAWIDFKKPLIESTDNRFYKWIMKIYFKF